MRVWTILDFAATITYSPSMGNKQLQEAVSLYTIQRWEHRMYRWMEVYSRFIDWDSVLMMLKFRWISAQRSTSRIDAFQRWLHVRSIEYRHSTVPMRQFRLCKITILTQFWSSVATAWLGPVMTDFGWLSQIKKSSCHWSQVARINGDLKRSNYDLNH